MVSIRCLICLVCLAWFVGTNHLWSQTFAPDMASQDLEFRVADLDGNSVELVAADEPRLTVVCFLGTECPLAKLYASRLNQLADKYPAVRFIGLGSNQQDSTEELADFRRRFEITFALAKDNENVIADQFQATRTPEVFVVDQTLTIVYQGRIDDQYLPGVPRSSPRRNDLELALSELLAGKPVTVKKTDAAGCLIGRVRTASKSNITYSNHISRLLQNHCSECHREGEIGPMAFSQYDEVKGWAEMIAEVVNENRMPPWHADPAHGEFMNERRMTSAEKQMINDWVAAGSPLGDTSQLPPPLSHPPTSDWRLPREPDTVFAMAKNPFAVPAEGTVEYQYFVVDPKFKEDKWIIAAEILPGNRSVVHHSIVFVRPPDGSSMRGIGWLAAYVPGQTAPLINPKFGRRIEAGSKLIFQQHYTTTGKAETDMTKIGLLFGDEAKIEQEVFTLLAADQNFVIPPNADNHIVNGSFRWIPKQGHLLGISPHMHFRGKSFKLWANLRPTPSPNRNLEPVSKPTPETLLNVPDYDFNWQHIYQLKNPIPTNRIQSLDFEVAFDNSADNPANPDPNQQVMWGDQTWEEMAVAFVIVSMPRKMPKLVAAEPSPQRIQAMEKYEGFIADKAQIFVRDYFARFDSNQDGKIVMSELPRSVRDFGRWQIDDGYDGVITPEEIQENVKYYLRQKFPPRKFDPVLASD